MQLCVLYRTTCIEYLEIKQDSVADIKSIKAKESLLISFCLDFGLKF